MNKIEKYTNWILKGLLISIAVITPFIVTNDLFFPFITGKNFFFRVLVEISLGVWIFLILINKRYQPKKSPILFSLIGLIGVMFLADIFGQDFTRSFWSNFERMEGFIGLFHLFIYFVILSSVFKTWTDWRFFFRASILASIIMAFYGFLQISGNITINQGGVRVDGTLGNAIYLAVYMMFNFFFALMLILRDKSRLWRFFYGLSMISSLLIIYFSATRGVMLGLFGGLLLFSLILVVHKGVSKKIKKPVGIFLLALIILGVGFVLVRNSEFIRNYPPLARLADISLESQDAKARLMVWQSAISGFKERPILGWGQENFGLVFNKYYDPEMYDREQWFDRAHNALLDWLIAGGILALTLYLLVIIYSLILIWKKREEHESHSLSTIDKALFTSVLGAYVFQSLFVFDNLMSSVIFFSLLAFAHSVYVLNRDQTIFNESNLEIKDHNQIIVSVAVLFVFVLSMIYFFNYKGFMTAKTLIQAIIPQEEGIDKNIELFKKALSYNSIGTQEVREHLMQGAISLAGNQNIKIEKRNEVVNLALTEMKKQVEDEPKDARTRYFLGSYLSVLGDHDGAILELEKALEYAPNKTGILIEMATVYLRKGDAEKAFEYAKRFYNDSISLKSIKNAYITIVIYAGKQKEADALLVQMTAEEKNDDRILMAFASTKQFNRIVEILEPLFDKTEDKNLGVSLSAAYLEMGYKTKAIGVMRRLIENDPSFKAQGEEYIRQINNF